MTTQFFLRGAYFTQNFRNPQIILSLFSNNDEILHLIHNSVGVRDDNKKNQAMNFHHPRELLQRIYYLG